MVTVKRSRNQVNLRMGNYAIIPDGMSIKENVAAVRKRIAAAAERAGREAAQVKLVAAIKYVPLDAIFRALEAGITDLAESRAQEAAERNEAIRARFPKTTFHFIGHLQRNKVGQAVKLFDIIQSVDSERLAREIDRQAGAEKKIMPVLVEVNVSGEQSKFGVPVTAARELIEQITALPNLKLEGLMTMAPIGDARPSFAGLRSFRDSLQLSKADLTCLSMGMSADFETAIAEGSTLVRIGRAIFSA